MLTIAAEAGGGGSKAPSAPVKAGAAFVPRTAASRSKAAPRKLGLGAPATSTTGESSAGKAAPSFAPAASTGGGKGQDDFRKLLGTKK